MQFILLNCTPKLKAMGIDPSLDGWQTQFANKLISYVTAESWSYDYGKDTLIIIPSNGSSVSTNLTDFGDAGGVVL